MKLKTGDLLRYSDSSWCKHGLALVDDSGRAWDTYWGQTSGEHPLEPSDLANATILGNLDDFTKYVSYPFDYWDYAEDDRLFIPLGSSGERRFVRRAAIPVRELVEQRMQGLIESAERSVVNAKRQQAEARKALEVTP